MVTTGTLVNTKSTTPTAGGDASFMDFFRKADEKEKPLSPHGVNESIASSAGGDVTKPVVTSPPAVVVQATSPPLPIATTTSIHNIPPALVGNDKLKSELDLLERQYKEDAAEILKAYESKREAIIKKYEAKK